MTNLPNIFRRINHLVAFTIQVALLSFSALVANNSPSMAQPLTEGGDTRTFLFSFAPKTVPYSMSECEDDIWQCSVFLFNGLDGELKGQNNARGRLHVESYDRDGNITISRHDVEGSSAGLTAMYKGKLTSTGAAGMVTFDWPPRLVHVSTTWAAQFESINGGEAIARYNGAIALSQYYHQMFDQAVQMKKPLPAALQFAQANEFQILRWKHEADLRGNDGLSNAQVLLLGSDPTCATTKAKGITAAEAYVELAIGKQGFLSGTALAGSYGFLLQPNFLTKTNQKIEMDCLMRIAADGNIPGALPWAATQETDLFLKQQKLLELVNRGSVPAMKLLADIKAKSNDLDGAKTSFPKRM